MIWDQTDESRGMQGRLKDSIGDHGANQGAHRLVDAGLAVVSLSENLDESIFVRWSDLLEVVPPVVRIVQEPLNGFRLKLLF